MRLIGHLADESTAKTFADYLYVQGIQNQLEHETTDGWGIWISDEDQLDHASGLLVAYRQNPDDPKYQAGGKTAGKLRAKEEDDKEAYHKKIRNRRDLFRPLTGYGFGPLTFALIVCSIIVFAVSSFGDKPEPIMSLFITDFGSSFDNTLPELRQGQLWRIFTPIFIHFGPLHIIFNMLWLRDLGSMIEGRQSSFYLFCLVMAFAGCSNLAQFFIGHSPNFGGMSGVIYGLLGYIWLRGKFDPGSGLYLHQTTVVSMLVWFVACYTGYLGHVANTAHAVGLVMGMAWGYLSSLRRRR